MSNLSFTFTLVKIAVSIIIDNKNEVIGINGNSNGCNRPISKPHPANNWHQAK